MTDFAVEKCREMIRQSKTDFEKIDTEELGLYLSLTMNTEEIKKQKIEDFVQQGREQEKDRRSQGVG